MLSALKPNPIINSYFSIFFKSLPLAMTILLAACGGGAETEDNTQPPVDNISDVDNDGIPDSRDAFPNDPSEQFDSDGDGVGDNTDEYPNDPTKQLRPATEEDSQAPILTEVTSIGVVTTDTPQYTFHSNEEGSINYTGSCSSETINANQGNNLIIFNSLDAAIYDNCVITVTDAAGNTSIDLNVTPFEIANIIEPEPEDTTAPELNETSPIGEASTYSPVYTFSSTEAGVISYFGSCSSTDTDAIEGINYVTLNALIEGVYDNCKISVIDSSGNESLQLSISTFTILDSTPPTLSNPEQIDPGSNLTVSFSFESNEAGVIAWSGDCTSAGSNAVIGTNTFDLNIANFGTFSNCSLTVSDAQGNTSTSLDIPDFSALPYSVWVSSWQGESDTLISFPSEVNGFEYHRSTDSNCDITEIESCDNAQADTLDNNFVTATGDLANPNSYGAHILRTGTESSQRTPKLADLSYGDAQIGSWENFRSLVFNGKLWVTHGDNGNGYSSRIYSNYVWSSRDGQEWSLESSNASYARSEHSAVSFNGKMWVIHGYDHEETYGYREYRRNVYSSTDGLTWNRSSYGPFPPRSGHHSVVFNNKLWVLGGTDFRKNVSNNYLNDIWSMDTNGAWTEVSDNGGYPTTGILSIIEFDNKLWMFRNGAAWNSSDGENWSEVTMTEPYHINNGVSPHWAVFNNEIWMIGARSNGEIMKSTDGLSWEYVKTESLIDNNKAQQLLVHDGQLVLLGVGLDGYTLKSIDGINWRRGYSSRFIFPQVAP
jgi:hypothetical protein